MINGNRARLNGIRILVIFEHLLELELHLIGALAIIVFSSNIWYYFPKIIVILLEYQHFALLGMGGDRSSY